MANQNFKQWLEEEAIPREQRLNDEVFSLLRYANEETGGNDTTLGAAVIRLVQGYGQGGGLPWWWEWMNNNPLNVPFDNAAAKSLPETIRFDLRGTKISSLGALFNASSVPVKTIEIIYPDKSVVPSVSISGVAGGGGFKPAGVTTIKLRHGDSEIVTIRNAVFTYFANSPTVEVVDCVFDLSLLTGNAGWANHQTAAGLREIRFKANSYSGGTSTGANTFNFSQSPNLSADSLCSIANALKTASGKQLTLHATSKTNCNGIMGRVEQRTDDTGTYDFFVQDDSGTMTLTNFITSVKGWTIA